MSDPYDCPHCGSNKEPFFSRSVPMGFYCRDCGKDVDKKQSDQTMSDTPNTVKSESANINTKSESADIECQECLDQSRLLGMSAERECALLGKIDRIERDRDEYKGILIELYNDINVIHSGNAIAKLNKMFKEENYN
jgi:hypothetical protein